MYSWPGHTHRVFVGRVAGLPHSYPDSGVKHDVHAHSYVDVRVFGNWRKYCTKPVSSQILSMYPKWGQREGKLILCAKI